MNARTGIHAFIKITLLAGTLLVAACATNPRLVIVDAENMCPRVGINALSPNFYLKHKQADVENFYTCMEKTMQDDPRTPGGYSSDISPFITDMEFQRTLWRQIASGEKSTTAAQQAWMIWIQNNNAINAQKDAAVASNRAAWAQSQPRQTTCVQQGRYLNCYQY